MVENKLECDIISLYEKNLVNLLSINQIATLLGKKYPYINKKVTDLINQGILKKIIVGKSYLCSLNLDNPKTLLLLSLIEINKKENLIENQKAKNDLVKIEDFLKANELELTVHSVIKHDNKFLFIIENIKDRRRVEREFDKCNVVDKKEFLDLLSEEPTIFSDHLVIYGIEKFFELVKIELAELKRLYSPLRY